MKVRYQLQSDQTEIETRDELEWPSPSQVVHLKKGTFSVVDTEVGFEDGQEFVVAVIRPGKPGKKSPVAL